MDIPPYSALIPDSIQHNPSPLTQTPSVVIENVNAGAKLKPTKAGKKEGCAPGCLIL